MFSKKKHQKSKYLEKEPFKFKNIFLGYLTPQEDHKFHLLPKNHTVGNSGKVTDKMQVLGYSGLFLLLAVIFLLARQSILTKTPKGNSGVPQVLGQTTEKIRGVGPLETFLIPSKKNNASIDFRGVSAESFMVVDENSKTILLEKQPHLKLPIASLTKLMTTLVAFEQLNPNDYIIINQNDVLRVNPIINLVAADEIKILDLLEAVLICSANDAANTLAKAVEKQNKTSITGLMNKRAEELNLFETRFSNPLGFDSDNNYSSASDLLKLTYFTQNFAIFKNISKRSEISFNSKGQKKFHCKATNKLIGKNLEIESIKTGYTQNARGSIIARVKRGNISLIVIAIKSEKREQDLLLLSDLAFNNFYP